MQVAVLDTPDVVFQSNATLRYILLHNLNPSLTDSTLPKLTTVFFFPSVARSKGDNLLCGGSLIEHVSNITCYGVVLFIPHCLN